MTAASTARGINEWILARYIGQSFDITLMNGARLASSGEGGQGMLNKNLYNVTCSFRSLEDL